MTFITDIAPAAQTVGRKYNILPSLILAQAILESNYGQSTLAQKGFNLFGIKGSYEGQCISLPTKEYQNGKWITITSKFRKYPSWKESMEDHALLFTNGVSWDRGKYHNLIGETDYKKACIKVQQDGYATDPQYSTKLITLIEQYHLNDYDPKVVTPPPSETKPQQPSEIVYIVKPGDSLSKILGSSNPSIINEVAARNGIKDPNKIYVGQKIYIKGTPQPAAPAKPSQTVYIVKKGDSLSKILGTSNKAKIDEVCKRNGIKNPNLIYVGQKLYL